MVKKVYGQHIKTITWIDGDGAIVNRQLEIYQTKKSIKALLWDSGKRYWREEPNKPIEVKEAKISIAGADNAIASICEMLGVPSNARVNDNPFNNFGTIKPKTY